MGENSKDPEGVDSTTKISWNLVLNVPKHHVQQKHGGNPG